MKIPHNLFVRCINVNILERNVRRLQCSCVSCGITEKKTQRIIYTKARISELRELIAQDLSIVLKKLEARYPGKFFAIDAIYETARVHQFRLVKGEVVDDIKNVMEDVLANKTGIHMRGVVTVVNNLQTLGYMTNPGMGAAIL